jgi:uncharacterized protein Veg
MIKSGKDISLVKKEIMSFKGEKVSVKVNLGRNKFVSFSGRLTSIYPALFTVSPTDDFKGKTSFSYAEVLCGNVAIKRFCENMDEVVS